MKIAICDDNPHEVNYLTKVCIDFDIKADVIGYSNGALLYEALRQTNADIIFLDVDMPGENGIEVGKMIRSFDTTALIIFCTSYPQYAVESYDCDAFHYLLKPCPKEKIQTILKRAYERIEIRASSITIKQRNVPRQLLIKDIYYVECLKKHLVYHLKKEDIETPGRISSANTDLEKFGFFQVHQGYIVNMKKILKFEGPFIVLTDQRRVPVSVRKKSEVLLAYANFLERNV